MYNAFSMNQDLYPNCKKHANTGEMPGGSLNMALRKPQGEGGGKRHLVSWEITALFLHEVGPC